MIVAGALVLGVSELMTAFEFTPPGGEALRDATSADRHGYSMLVLAVCAVGALAIAIATGSKPAAYAVAAIGVVSLLLFLIVDLPDAGKLGDLEDPVRGIASGPRRAPVRLLAPGARRGHPGARRRRLRHPDQRTARALPTASAGGESDEGAEARAHRQLDTAGGRAAGPGAASGAARRRAARPAHNRR